MGPCLGLGGGFPDMTKQTSSLPSIEEDGGETSIQTKHGFGLGRNLSIIRYAGMLLRDLILDRDDPWTTLYDPTRKRLRAAVNLRGRKSKCCWAICRMDDANWNSTERSWDCPCHGSRFEPSGKVLNGPAIGPLEKVPHDSSQ